MAVPEVGQYVLKRTQHLLTVVVMVVESLSALVQVAHMDAVAVVVPVVVCLALVEDEIAVVVVLWRRLVMLVEP